MTTASASKPCHLTWLFVGRLFTLAKCQPMARTSVNSCSANEEQWLAEARAALPVPQSLAKTIAESSRDPKRLYAYRSRLATLVGRSAVSDADPRGKEFDDRGSQSAEDPNL